MTRGRFREACRSLLSALESLLTDLEGKPEGVYWRAEFASLVDELEDSLGRDHGNELEAVRSETTS